MANPEIDLLLDALDTAYDRRAWHGSNLRGALRGITVAEAAWRPAAGRHNIWELAVHAAYWKYAVLRTLTGLPQGSFPVPGSNWFSRPESATPAAWRADLALLGKTHRALRAAVEALDPALLPTQAPRSRYRYRQIILGVASHDLYHAGQIQLLKRLRRRE